MKFKFFFFWATCVFLTSNYNHAFAQATEYISSGGTNPQGRIYYDIVDGHAEIRTPGQAPSMYNNWTAPSWSNYAQYKPAGIINIPDSIDCYGSKYCVSVIGYRAFDQCNGITHINIPNTVTSIGFRAFCGCTNIDSITIPDNVTVIEEEAFCGDTSLCYINIGSGVITIGERAFASTGVDSIIIPASVNTIGIHAFQGNKRLSQIYIPENVTHIGYGISSYCDSLTSIIVSSNNPVYDSRGNCNAIIETSSNKLIAGCMNSIIDSSVSVIDTFAFEYCKGLTSVSIGSGVNNINSGAFYGCDNIHSLTIPDGVKIVGSYAFGNCDSLLSVSIGRGVISINRSAFAYCTNLHTVVYNADSCIFAGDSIYSYQLSSNNVFHECQNLSHIIIGDSVRYIPDFLFYFYYDERPFGVTKITIPSLVNYIGRNAFCELPNLDTIIMMPETAPELGPTPWLNSTVIIPRCSYGNYINSPSWSNYYSRIHEPEINISINVNSSNTERGNAGVVRLYNRDVRCDSSAVIFATVNNGFHFGCWSNGNIQNPDTLHLIHDSTIVANFFYFNAISNDINLGSVEHTKISDRIERTIAIPQYGYHFTHWSNGRTSNPDTIYLSSDSVITAFYERNEYTLTAITNDSSMGVIIFPDGETALFGDTIMVVAQPAEHHHVDYWSENINAISHDTVWVIITGDISITCTFAIDVHNVSVSPNFSDRGTITGGGEYAYGSPCVLTAIPYTGFVFSQWSNGITANSYAFPVTEDIELMAIFEEEGTQGIDDVATTDNIRIFSMYDRILIDGLNGQDVTIYSIDGRTIASLPKATEHVTIPVHVPGVYIVKIGNYPAQKVVVIR